MLRSMGVRVLILLLMLFWQRSQVVCVIVWGCSWRSRYRRYGDAGSGGKTIESCRERSTFGMPLMENQWIHFKLSDLLTEIEILKQFNDHCARIIIRGEDATREVSMGKLTAGCLAREVADTCVPFHGGMGFMEEYPLARYFRDARLLSIGGGVDEVMLGVVAKLEGILPSRKKKG